MIERLGARHGATAVEHISTPWSTPSNSGRRAASAFLLPPFFLCFAGCALVTSAAVGQRSPVPPIGTIEIYGLRTLDETAVRSALPFREGDNALPQLEVDLGDRLARQLGVTRVQLDGTCCDDSGRVLVFVGIDEKGGLSPTFRPAPSGAIRLPDDVYNAFLDFNAILRRESFSGNVTEDLSAGHSLVSHPDARRIQERFIAFAPERLDAIRRALRMSGDEGHRSAAAYIIGYTADKQEVVEDLVWASSDPSPSVRTNATRALAAIANLGSTVPRLGISIPPDPFITMANSVMYDERSRGIRVLRPLSAARDPVVLEAIRDGALAALIEMSRWTYSGHNRAPYQILGRVLGLPEEEIDETADGRRDAVLARAAALLN